MNKLTKEYSKARNNAGAMVRKINFNIINLLISEEGSNAEILEALELSKSFILAAEARKQEA